MWQTVRIGNESYHVDVQDDAQDRKVHIRALVFGALWNAEVSYDEIVNEMKKLNEFLEFEEHELISDMTKLFDEDRKDVQWSIKREDVQLQLHLTSTREKIEYSFKAILHPSDSFLNYRILVLPMMIRMKAMTEELRKKDNEILEHRMNGSKITRKSIETAAFDENSFEISPQSLNAILSNHHAKDLFDRPMISYFNQIQPVIRDRLSENYQAKKESSMKAKRKLSNSSSGPVSKKITSELIGKKEEKIRSIMFHKMSSIHSQKSRPAKKLRGL